MIGAQMMMMEGYGDPRPVREFLSRIIEADEELSDLLRGAGPSRLVVVKPNWIQESHEQRPEVWEPVITHPTVVLAVVDALAYAMGGRGTICVCDAPHTYADFEAILEHGAVRAGIGEIRGRWPGLDIEIQDLRRETWIRKEQVVVERRPNPEDKRGYVRLNLGRDSLFYNHRGEGRYYGADYDTRIVNEHHRGAVQEYLLAGSPMACDLFVNVPKLKTHKKTGITCCLKNLVGINGDKNWLPHHTESTPAFGGDEFPDGSMARSLEMHLKRAGRRLAVSLPGVGTWLYRKARKVGTLALGESDTVVRNGNWRGNDTCWRMALDLNRALLYGNTDGTWRDAGVPPRPYLAIVDGIIGGEGNGPLSPDPVRSGVLLAGRNPAVLDAVAARLMGFDPASLPIVSESFAARRWPISDRPLDQVAVADPRQGGREIPIERLEPAVHGGFRPHFGWAGRTAGS